MERTDILPERIRWLALATGIASALALFPALLLLYPALLIVGGVVQPRHRSAGKWLVWIGAANLGLVVIIYDAMLFPHPWLHPHYMTLTFSVTTIFLIWLFAELVSERRKRRHAHRSLPETGLTPVSKSEWIVAAILNCTAAWVGANWLLASVRYRYLAGFDQFAMSILQAAQVLPVVAYDISLIKRTLKQRSIESESQG